MKVVRFLDQTTHVPKIPPVEVAETGWRWTTRQAWLSVLSSVLGTVVCGSLLFHLILPGYVATGHWSIILVGLLVLAALTAVIQYQVSRLLFTGGLERVFNFINRAARQRTTVSKETLRKDAGIIGSQAATSLNMLITHVRAETAPAPLSAYRETFLASTQPAYVCNFTTGRFLDCNYAFADFVGMQREALLLQRLGDITVCGSATNDSEVGPIPPNLNEDSPIAEMQFRHTSGVALRSVTFFHAVPNPENPQHPVHCAMVVPQNSNL